MQLIMSMAEASNEIIPTFYHVLGTGGSIQRSVGIIRQKLYTKEAEGACWYLPVLYLRQPGDEPFILLERPANYPSNPFIGDGAFKDPALFVGREIEIQRIVDRLYAGGNLSIIGPAGSGKSTMLSMIAHKLWKMIEPKPKVIWLSLQRSMKLTDIQLMLARQLGGPKSKATDYMMLLENQHVILLLDDIGQLDQGERGLNIRLWLRQLSQDRSTYATIQLIATCLRPLKDIFQCDESPDYSPLHNVMSDNVELGTFTKDEAHLFVTRALEGTPFQLQHFADILTTSHTPRSLREHCRTRYEELSRNLTSL
jgi:hypothetical protein